MSQKPEHVLFIYSSHLCSFVAPKPCNPKLPTTWPDVPETLQLQLHAECSHFNSNFFKKMGPKTSPYRRGQKMSAQIETISKQDGPSEQDQRCFQTRTGKVSLDTQALKSRSQPLTLQVRRAPLDLQTSKTFKSPLHRNRAGL